ncbi:SidA/IucD/PvdA family monooxygenase [Streptomyces sp. MUM 203J]|uniref:lysine N(6)-hydroxylase/L-ornithine N(5)-oxygenase family protein n=1 Tax=Streptomyces sp. MUM 203J TaxID=2791990 RepID=UPI001F0363C3|nr:SidA/IucD/PvdA family monooxygenase [Streptomyces sp. MUM 203J]MCH0539874.1 SidA/IucD/PvdA family monooxygenase [Streptomyces sp. MUM 203J]
MTSEPTATATPSPSAEPAQPDPPHDLVGIGIGPGNLSLAALAHGVPGGLTTAFYEQRPTFQWHPGTLTDHTTLTTPFLADLVTLADPTSPWSYLNHLRSRHRLLPFHLARQLHIPRSEYETYARWVSDHLPGLHFGHHVDSIRWNPELDLFEVDYAHLDPHGETEALGRTHARNIALAAGTEPHIPEPLKPLVDAPAVPVVHSADYLHHRERLRTAEHITVIGSGQSGAEIFLDLLRSRPTGQEKLHWLTRTPAFTPTENTTLGLEHLTPDYSRYFHDLPEHTRNDLAPRHTHLHQGIDPTTLDAIHQELYRRSLHGAWPDTVLTPGVRVRTAGRLATTKVELHLEHTDQGTRSRLTTDAVILATGYRERPHHRLLAALDPYIRRDSRERPRVDTHHRIVLDPSVTGNIYLHTGTPHTHGPGATSHTLTAWRSAVILNHLTGKEPYPLPQRTALTTFGLEQREPPHIPPQEQRLTPLTRV